MRQRAILGAALLIAVGVVLGATVFRTDIAQATGLAQSKDVRVINTPAEAVPVREQNRDASGNIRIHEQGTANVNVTNSSLSVSPQSPITDGGNHTRVGGGTVLQFNTAQTASALVITMTDDVLELILALGDNQIAASFAGPHFFGDPDINLSLARPIRFDRIICTADTSEDCSVSWVGTEP